MSDYQASKQRLITGLRRAVQNHKDLVDDIAWWNANRTDAPPFDLGGDLSAGALAQKMLALVESNQPIPDDLWNRYREQCEANAAQ